MPDTDDLMSQFQEFLTQKAANERAASEEEDEEIELWNEKGQGARVRRSRAPSIARALGIDFLDDSPGEEGDASGDNDADKSKSASGRRSTGKQSSNVASGGTARKYFGPKATK